MSTNTMHAVSTLLCSRKERRTKRRTKRRTSDNIERGSSAVEFALVAPLLILLTFGVMEFGMFLWNLSQTQTSVAAATRTAGAQSRVDGYEDQVADTLRVTARSSTSTPLKLVVFKANPLTGRPTGLTTNTNDYSNCTADCYVFTWSTVTKTWTKLGSPTWPGNQQKACGPTSDTDFVGVWLNSRYGGITGVGLAKRNFATTGVARLEPVPLSTGQLCKP